MMTRCNDAKKDERAKKRERERERLFVKSQ